MNIINKSLGMAVVAVVLISVSAGLFSHQAAGDAKPQKSSTLSIHDQWRKLWEDHITWTRMVIVGVLNELPGTATYTERLLQNYVDMEDALEPYYGDSAEELGELIEEHLLIAAEILQAAKAGDTTALNDAIERWYANGHDNAVQMAAMNPKFWPLEMGDPMWKEHLDATLAEAVAHLEGNFAEDVAAYDLVHELALEMADFFSNGVISQFPGSFRGSRH